MRSKSFIIIGLIITSTISISGVYAISYNNWDCNDPFAAKAAVCYLAGLFDQNQKIMKQNNIIIKEQNQTNTLLAMEFCKGASSFQSFPQKYHTSDQQYMNDEQYFQCVKKVLGDTK